jgi:hypothetical protein
MLTNFSKFSKKMKVYGNDGLTMTFLANLQKTFHFWTFLKCLIFHMPEPIQNILKSRTRPFMKSTNPLP